MSPLLSNILLDDLDQELARRRLKFVRYADDFVIFVRCERAAQGVFMSVQRSLTQVLKLVVNEDQSRVRWARDCEYLGCALTGKPATISVAAKKLKAFKRRLQTLSGRSLGVSMQRRVTDLNRYVRGGAGYFGLAQQFDLFDKLDGWIRRRIRMCYWTRWRRARTTVKHLVRLGVSLDMAIKHALTRKSYWRLSSTPGMRIAMPHQWLHAQGLLSLKQLRCDLAPLRGTA